MDIDAYEQREQSAAKHLILEKYLETLALKVGQFRDGLTFNYVDGFSGPWEAKTEELSDTSPFRALQSLLSAREKLAERGRTFTVRAFFVSRDRPGAEKLAGFRGRFPQAQIEIVTGAFEDRIDDARQFVRTGRDPFAFLFIDPTGWTGFGLQAITPLLQEVRASEVLLNFMTKDISRFIDNGPANVGPSFVDLFGDASHREAWRGVTGLDREEAMVATYCERLRQAGGYRHCVSAMILNPKADRTHYHLIYGTHSPEGLVAFREVERKGLGFQKEQRAQAKQRSRVERSRQAELFGGLALQARSYEDELMARYLPRARRMLDAMLEDRADVPWDELVIAALQVPMVSEADVKQWVKERQEQGVAAITGLAPRARVPQRGEGHQVRRSR